MNIAVIGAGFGDEGKGLITDHLCRDRGIGMVVRHSGGANAGHTVVVDSQEGRYSHVFHHFGAGSLAEASTFLGKRFISNPILFRGERKRLVALLKVLADERGEDFEEDPLSEVMVDPRGLVTTPIDMLLNEMREEKLRYGSCAAGINETVTRSQFSQFSIDANTTQDPDTLQKIYDEIRRDWVPQRMKDMGMSPSDDPVRWEYINSEVIRDNWLADCDFYKNSVSFRHPGTGFLGDYDLVFEGSQGLLLDEQHEFFPHVTRARTGLTNVIEMCLEGAVSLDEVHYVTRSYMTRHGNGPFPTEGKEDDRVRSLPPDTTNKTGRWQGALRRGSLDLKLMKKAISSDMVQLTSQKKTSGVDAFIDITWLDGLGEPEDLADEVSETLNLRIGYGSDGPTSDHVFGF